MHSKEETAFSKSPTRKVLLEPCVVVSFVRFAWYVSKKVGTNTNKIVTVNTKRKCFKEKQHLKASNVDAIEAFHRSHSDGDRHRLWKLAEAYGLGVTVGSDFHSFNGGHRPGHMPVVINALPKLISSA